MNANLRAPAVHGRGFSVRRLVASIVWPVMLPSMLGCDGLFYYPTREIYGDPRAKGLAYESVYFNSKDGKRLHGWFFPAVEGPARGTVVHCHGNAGNITGHFDNVSWLPALGWNVLCFDYRGYGHSSGRPSRRGLIDDAHAAVDYVVRRPGVRSGTVVLFGQSLGGAIAIVVAAERDDLAGVAVEGAFTSYREVAALNVRRTLWLWLVAWWLPKLLMSDGWNPIDHVADVAPAPLLIAQGREDDIVDWQMARRLGRRAGPRTWVMLIDGAGHYGAFADDAPERQSLLAGFFGLCVRRDASSGEFDGLFERAGDDVAVLPCKMKDEG